MSEIESTYASSVTKLLKSVSYTFHSSVLMQWLGSDPFEELGYVNKYTLPPWHNMILKKSRNYKINYICMKEKFDVEF